jgi:hypothetical protein
MQGDHGTDADGLAACWTALLAEVIQGRNSTTTTEAASGGRGSPPGPWAGGGRAYYSGRWDGLRAGAA